MNMKIGIDSYCYHRYFGEVYPVQAAPDTTMTIEDFLARTSQEPVKTGRVVEFLIHSTSSEVNYTYTAYGLLEQIGKVGKI